MLEVTHCIVPIQSEVGISGTCPVNLTFMGLCILLKVIRQPPLLELSYHVSSKAF